MLEVASWPILYLLLQSYVREWPGVMCIYGVTRIGEGSAGISRFLPPLLAALQAMKPALVFLAGAWFVLYLLNRRTQTAPLTGRVLLVLLASALFGVVDATAEGAYLVIPKKEEAPTAGCCTEAFDAGSGASRLLPETLANEAAGGRLYAAYYGVNLGMALALAGCAWPRRGRPTPAWLAPLLAGAVLSILVNAVFLVEAAAPRLLHLPYHHCPYNLVPKAPESLVAAALFFGGAFSVGWACVAAWPGRRPETQPFLPEMVGGLLRLGFLGYLGSVVMVTLELALA